PGAWHGRRHLATGALPPAPPARPSLLGAPAPSGRLGSDPGLSDSDSEESVFSGLEDSGSDSTEDATASEEEGAGTSEQRSREETQTFVAEARTPCSRTEVANVQGENEYAEDSSDEEDIRNTVGNVPLEWYDDFPHVGYDLDGRRIYKPLRTRDELDQFLDKMDDPDYWRTVRDRMTGHSMRLTDEQVALVQRLQRGQFGDVSFDPYEPAVDFFSGDLMIHPVTNRPADKRSFIPSLVEKEKVGVGHPGGAPARPTPAPAPGRGVEVGAADPASSSQVNVDPEDLIPKLPRPRDLQPFPTCQALVYRGHNDLVRCLSVSPDGQWLASGSDDGSVRFWEVVTARCIRTVPVDGVVKSVAWNPHPTICLVAVAVEDTVLLLNPALGDRLVVGSTDQLLSAFTPPPEPTQSPFRRSHGQVQRVAFHPTRPFLLVASQRCVRLYHLLRQELTKKLMPNCKWVSSLAVHPAGDNVICGSYDRFDMDLSTKPYRVLRHHKKALRAVAFHPRYPLFASGSDDGSVIVCHGMVYNDLLQNPLLVPVKVLKGHALTRDLGVLDVAFHPTQPWVFSSGADGTLRLFT
ncbi:hypothetical protein K5549_018123, partial [Capra hircus]